jgi:hypothetical protein
MVLKDILVRALINRMKLSGDQKAIFKYKVWNYKSKKTDYIDIIFS